MITLKRFTPTGEEIAEEIFSGIETKSGFLAISRKMKDLKKDASKIAPTKLPVLITGETGTGKEILARFIHEQSNFEGEFIALNSAGLPETLVDSTLFGHEKGAFTGAMEKQQGSFQLAENGTLFFDEIGEMPLNVQAKILRATDPKNGEYAPIGAKKTIQTNCRLISATNSSIEELLKQKKFREDLFQRLVTIHLHIPPLRERHEDIIFLARFFLKETCASLQRSELSISEDALSFFKKYRWPGNVRELQEAINRAVAFCPSQKDTLEINDFKLMQDFATPVDSVTPGDIESLNTFEMEQKRIVCEALAKYGWNQTRAARSIGITRRKIAYAMEKFQIERPEKITILLPRPSSKINLRETKSERPDPASATSKKLKTAGRKNEPIADRTPAKKRSGFVISRVNLLKALAENEWIMTKTAISLNTSQPRISYLVKSFKIDCPWGNWRKRRKSISESPKTKFIAVPPNERKQGEIVTKKQARKKKNHFPKEKLKKMLENYGWSQTQTAKALGVTQPYVSSLAKRYALLPPSGKWNKRIKKIQSPPFAIP